MLMHNGLAISRRKEDLTSGKAVADLTPTINAIVLLISLAVRLQKFKSIGR